jgi:hypothetical protein
MYAPNGGVGISLHLVGSIISQITKAVTAAASTGAVR